MDHFTTAVRDVLSEYHQRMKTENKLMQELPIEEGMKRRDEFLLPVGEEVGRFLNALIKGSRALTILELGTSYGYSTVWLAEAARANGGKVITLELDPKKSDYAKGKIEQAKLSGVVDFRVGDALELLAKAEETFDFVLLDLWKELYVPCLECFYPKLNTEAYIVADNMIHPAIHSIETREYLSALKQKENFDSVLLPLGSGLEVSRLK